MQKIVDRIGSQITNIIDEKLGQKLLYKPFKANNNFSQIPIAKVDMRRYIDKTLVYPSKNSS